MRWRPLPRRTRAPRRLLFELIAERYERKSIAITANTPFSQWGEVFVDAAMTVAAVDRLVHHSTILGTRTSHAACWRHITFPEFDDSLGDGAPRHSTCAMYSADTTKAKTHGFTGRHNSTRTLVQKRPQQFELLRQLRQSSHELQSISLQTLM